ncbi:MAG: hypothetical protein SFZ03_02400 [Candidatus Melainabacteria bacterium]|nr:hypothetical protein [Candidatus Melainabacteria bacterium]
MENLSIRPTALIVEIGRISDETDRHPQQVQDAFELAGGNTSLLQHLSLQDFPETVNLNTGYDGQHPYLVEDPHISNAQDVREYVLGSLDFELGRTISMLDTVRTDERYQDVQAINASYALTEGMLLEEVMSKLTDDSELTATQIEEIIDQTLDSDNPRIAELEERLNASVQSLYEDQGTIFVTGNGNDGGIFQRMARLNAFRDQSIQPEADEDDTFFARMLGEQPNVFFAAASEPSGELSDYSSVIQGEQQQFAPQVPFRYRGTSFTAPVITAFIQQARAENPDITTEELESKLREAFPMPAGSIESGGFDPEIFERQSVSPF